MTDAPAALAPAVPLSAVHRAPVRLHVAPDAALRARLAAALRIEALDAYAAEVEVRPWLDGAVAHATWTARVRQLCGVSLEPFATDLDSRFERHVVPSGSPYAPAPETELAIDPEADDPPDVLEGEAIDLGLILFEQLALLLDPFPRAPGAVFTPVTEDASLSPFAALAGFGSALDAPDDDKA